MNTRNLARRSGFTLVELAVVIAILSLLGVGVYVFTDIGGRGKAVTLLNYMQQIGGALQRLRADTGCHTQRIPGLWTNAANGAGATFCGAAISDNSWRGPYLKPFSTDPTSGAGLLDGIVSGATVSIAREDGGIGQRYFLRATNVPNDIVIQVLQECNGSISSGATFDTNHCRAAAAGAASGSVDYLYDESR